MNSIINSQELFHLSDPFANQPYRLSPVKEQDDWFNSKMAYLLFTGQKQPPEPVTLKPAMGGRPMDILWSSFPPVLCVSQKIIDIFKKNNFKGWGIYPVKIYDKQSVLLPGYNGFSVISTVGNQDISRSKIFVKPPPTPKGKPMEMYHGLYFDESKWDGSDIFRVEAAHIIITKAVRDVLKKNKIRNILLTPLTEHEILTFTYKITHANK
jgi:hypothetical protein